MYKSVLFIAAMVWYTAAEEALSVLETDITPEEAQRFLNSPPFLEPQLSGKTATLPLVRWNDPQFRSAEAGPTNGHYWKNGKEIENTNDYVEEVYNAAQYHGQDGLGAYAYGYKGPDSSKVENRVHSGDVTGSYTYKDGSNGLITVRYWADKEGFHQEDNLPKVVLEPAQETTEVREARLAHEKAWNEAATAAAQQPDPQGEYHTEYQGAHSEPHDVVVPLNNNREGKSYYDNESPNLYQNQPQYQVHKLNGQNSVYHGRHLNVHNQANQAHENAAYSNGFQQQASAQSNVYQGQGQAYQAKAQSKVYSGQYNQGQQAQNQGQQSSQYQQGQQSSQYQQGQQSSGQYNPDAEPTGPPRGFFYSFNYPVSIIVPKNEAQGDHDHTYGVHVEAQ